MLFKFLFGSPLPAGVKAPDFALQDQTGQTRRLADYQGRWVVLYFYPRDNTPLCTREACSFRDEMPKFAADVAVLGVSPDSVDSHRDFAQQHNLNFPVLADPQGQTAQHYGVRTGMGLTNRVTFLIDPQSVVRDRLEWVNWNRYGETVQSRLAKLRA